MRLVCGRCGGLAGGGGLVNCIWVFFAEVCLLILSKMFIHSYVGYLLAVLVPGILPAVGSL